MSEQEEYDAWRVLTEGQNLTRYDVFSAGFNAGTRKTGTSTEAGAEGRHVEVAEVTEQDRAAAAWTCASPSCVDWDSEEGELTGTLCSKSERIFTLITKARAEGSERVLVGDEAGAHLADMMERLVANHPGGMIPVEKLLEIAANVRLECGGWRGEDWSFARAEGAAAERESCERIADSYRANPLGTLNPYGRGRMDAASCILNDIRARHASPPTNEEE